MNIKFKTALVFVFLIVCSTIFCGCDHPQPKAVAGFDNLTFSHILYDSNQLEEYLTKQNDGDVVKLGAGVYNLKNFEISKQVTIVGTGKEATIVKIEDGGSFFASSANLKIYGVQFHTTNTCQINSQNCVLFQTIFKLSEIKKDNPLALKVTNCNDFVFVENEIVGGIEIEQLNTTSTCNIANNQIVDAIEIAIRIISNDKTLQAKQIADAQEKLQLNKEYEKIAKCAIISSDGQILNKYE